jgi:hypothetical protein
MDQTFGGPPAGHDFASPVSLETPVRSGPRHCGHSSEVPADAKAPRGKSGAASNGKKFLRFMRKGPKRPSAHYLPNSVWDTTEAPLSAEITRYRETGPTS